MANTVVYLEPRNREHGFYGTVWTKSGHSLPVSLGAWNAAFRKVTQETSWANTQVRDFLDSTYGRHLADDWDTAQPGSGWVGRAYREFAYTYDPADFDIQDPAGAADGAL